MWVWSQCAQKLNEQARSMTDLQPTGLAFRRLKIWFLLGYKSSHTCEISHTEQESFS